MTSPIFALALVAIMCFLAGADLAAVLRWGSDGLGYDLGPIETMSAAFVVILLAFGLGLLAAGVTTPPPRSESSSFGEREL